MEDTEKRFIADGLRDLAIHHKLVAPPSSQAPHHPATVLLGQHSAPQQGAEGQYDNGQSCYGEANNSYDDWEWPQSAPSAHPYDQEYGHTAAYQWESTTSSQPYYDDTQWNDPYHHAPPQDSYYDPYYQPLQHAQDPSYPAIEEKVFFADEYTEDNYQEDAYEEEAAQPPSPDHVYDAEHGW